MLAQMKIWDKNFRWEEEEKGGRWAAMAASKARFTILLMSC